MPKVNAVDLIPHRKGYEDIQKEIEEYYSKPDVPLNKGVDRTNLVKTLQKKYTKGRGALPKGAELPMVESTELDKGLEHDEEMRRRALAKIPQSKLMFTQKQQPVDPNAGRDMKNRPKSEIDNELNDLYDQIENEIVERQKFLEEIETLEEPKLKEKVKAEIASRIAELQKVIKMMNEP